MLPAVGACDSKTVKPQVVWRDSLPHRKKWMMGEMIAVIKAFVKIYSRIDFKFSS